VIRRAACFLLSWVMLGLAGCGLIGLPPSGTRTPSLQPDGETQAALTPTGKITLEKTAAPGDTPFPTVVSDFQATPEKPQKLMLWLPPQFDPSANNQAATILRSQLQEFSRQNGGIKVEVRLKAATGPGGLLDALTATNAAAQGALPDLVALTPPDLEGAALKGLIFPFDGLTQTPDDPDWYAYARQLVILQGSSFGLPFAGDALVLLYRSSQVPALPKDWASLLQQPGALAFPAADPQAFFTLALYESAGGQVADSQHRPLLTANSLAIVLKLYETGVKSGKLQPWLVQSASDGQAWQAYREQQADWVVTWVSRYLSELPADTSLLPLMPVGDAPFTLATGWAWSMAAPTPERRALAVKLAEFLVKSDFLARWTASAGYLPPRPTALAGWQNQSQQNFLSQIELSAQARPGNDLLTSLGPLIKDAVVLVIKGQSDPVQAAQAAAEHLKLP
jgi:ABC-type glycerol-3-phosphate transport system substrate-binding protein